ncbi:retinol dehydrogenase 12-like [Bemisia tabaci]|uniref:retinol dehydrogenase 12-like n=1 Tax=Bemisia tabaci TaxID=7038 RepID=UPI003B28AB5D
MSDALLWVWQHLRDAPGHVMSHLCAGKCKSKARLDGKVAIITGCNSGMGKETAMELYKRGAFFPTRELTQDGHELQFQTNYLGHFLFTRLLLPKIMKSAPARIITVSSIAYIWGDDKMHYDDITLERSYTPYRAYIRSKLANVLFSAELARRLKGTEVTTYSLHPGLVATDIFRHLEEMPDVSKFWKCIFLSRYSKLYYKSARCGAETILHCCLDENAGKETGLYYTDCKPRKLIKRARDQEEAMRLWEYSWTAVGLSKDYDPFVKGSTRLLE